MSSETTFRDFFATPAELVLKVATVAADMGFLGFEPYDNQSKYIRTNEAYLVTLYFRKRKDG